MSNASFIEKVQPFGGLPQVEHPLGSATIPTLTAVITSAMPDVTHGAIVYGTVAGERVAVGLGLRTYTGAMDARIVAEGYRRVGDWTKHGPLDYSAPIEAHPQRCETCVNGCDCEAGTPGCGHAYCWGVVSDELHNSCPGVAAVRSEPTGAGR